MKNGTFRTICSLCHCSCGIVAELKDGRLKRLNGDEENPANRGYLCPKAASIEELSCSPDRLTMPLKKVNGVFQEVSWEEAFDYAAQRLKEILGEHGPDGLMRCSGAPVSYDARDGFNYLMRLCRSANATGSSTYCMVPRVTAFANMMGGKPEPDFDHADFIILWGCNPQATNRLGGYCAFDGISNVLDRARARGAQIVFIDPVKNETICEGDEWIQIFPGTDVVLGLALLRQIINGDLYDHVFVDNYTVGFEELRAHVQPYTPEYTQEKTGIPAEAVVSLAERFARSQQATICEGNGLDMYCNTVYTVQTVAALLSITGRVDVPGGVVFLPFVPQSPMNNLSPASMALKPRYPLFRDVPFPAVKEALLSNDPRRPRAMIVHHANPVLINANSNRTREAMKKLDFLMVCDVFMTATAELADLVLPAKNGFESYGYKSYVSFDRCFLAFAQPLFEAPGQARSVFEMEYEIGKRMGFENQYPFKDEVSWINFALEPSGVSFEELRDKQLIFFDKPIVYEKYKQKGFQTPSKKIELFSSRLESCGYSPLPLPLPGGGPKLEEQAEKYPLYIINYRPGAFVHTKLHNITAATGRHPMPRVWIRPEDAEAYGVQEGDTVTVETAVGRGEFCAQLRDTPYAGMIMLEFGWGNPTDQGTDLNSITSDACGDPISGGSPNRLYRGRICGIMGNPQ